MPDAQTTPAGHTPDWQEVGPALLEALIEVRKALAIAVIAHSGGLFDSSTVAAHTVVAVADRAIALARTGDA